MRKFLVAGNWKMNLLRQDAAFYAERLRHGLGDFAGDVAIFVPFPWLVPVADRLRGSPVMVGGQDLHASPAGAHTGDTSGAQLASAGARAVLCGHSERRADHAESSSLVAAKVRAAQDSGLLPVLCVGETIEQREAGNTLAILTEQLGAVLGEPAIKSEPLIVAYEPVWAIGTGSIASPEQASKAHAQIRDLVRSARGNACGADLRILYGGSAKPENCEDLAAQEEIDGFLVGGASLDPGSFLDMIRRCGVAAARRLQ